MQANRILSIIIPMYNEEESLEKLYNSIKINVEKCITDKLISITDLSNSAGLR